MDLGLVMVIWWRSLLILTTLERRDSYLEMKGLHLIMTLTFSDINYFIIIYIKSLILKFPL